jgi:hypothetical protein
MRTIARLLAGVITILILVFIVAAVISALINLRRPTQSATPDSLSIDEQSRLAEFFHAREAVGDAVWPGWGAADIPVIAYNEANAFLVGLTDPADGWVEVPQDQPHGGPWESTAVTIDGRTVYRQSLAGPDETPQAFTVLVGDRWVASLATMEWFRIGLANQIHDDLPPVLNLVFPFGLATRQLVGGSDHYITLVAHEAFHAYQGATASERLAAAERAAAGETAYPWDDAALEAAWQAELDLLAEAAAAPPETAAEYAREFLRLRAERREAAGLAPSLVDYERQREWLEGLARYAELGLWREAALETYRPVTAILDDPEFEGYTGYDRRLRREIDQIGRMAGDVGDGRFYYSGYVQAVLLDRLLPGWKARAFEPDVFLEDLLAEVTALSHPGGIIFSPVSVILE